MGVREIDRFLEQWQMDARDLHRSFQMHHSFSVAIYAIPGSMAGVVVVCAGPSRAMPSQTGLVTRESRFGQLLTNDSRASRSACSNMFLSP